MTAPHAVFRTNPLSVLGALAIAVCFTPVAFAGPFLWLLYLAPIGMAVRILRVRTTVDAEALAVRKVIGGRRVSWSEISSLHLEPRHPIWGGRVSAVLSDGAELSLPAVGLRDLPELAAVSGGRLLDPAGEN